MVWSSLVSSAVLGLTALACRYGFDSRGEPAGDAAIDATVVIPDDAGTCEPMACAAAGGSCVGLACELVANGEGLLACPAGMPCRLRCEGFRYCRDGARCAGASFCEVRCKGERTCQSGVDCGASPCVVTCDGTEACESGISATGACASHCCGSQACAGGVGTCTRDATCS